MDIDQAEGIESLWIEEILHQLIDGVSPYPIIYRVSTIQGNQFFQIGEISPLMVIRSYLACSLSMLPGGSGGSHFIMIPSLSR